MTYGKYHIIFFIFIEKFSYYLKKIGSPYYWYWYTKFSPLFSYD